MTTRNCVAICQASDATKAENLVNQFPGGSGTFSIRLTNVQGGTVPTHLAGSGLMEQDMATALEVSVDPMIQLVYLDIDLTLATFDDVIATRIPRLYRVVDEL